MPPPDPDGPLVREILYKRAIIDLAQLMAVARNHSVRRKEPHRDAHGRTMVNDDARRQIPRRQVEHRHSYYFDEVNVVHADRDDPDNLACLRVGAADDDVGMGSELRLLILPH